MILVTIFPKKVALN